MFDKPVITECFPFERIPQVVMDEQSEVFVENKLLINLVDSISQMLVIMNAERQIIYANKPYLDFCGISDIKSVVGKRPGEVLNCKHAFVTEMGCGTSEFCQSCGGANAIYTSQLGRQATKECRISTLDKESLDLRVTSTPYKYGGQALTIFALIDISSEKRRESLERVFFHDILNSAGGISGLSNILKEIDNHEELVEVAETITHAANNLVEEIQLQRQISLAERRELIPDFKEINSQALLNDLKSIYSVQQVITDKAIVIDENSENLFLRTDPVLLRRILSNMIKNALEDFNPRAQVTLRCESKEGSVQFSVHNNKFIERKVQLQLFNRSFTTKGMGRGLGTYSMKLLGENYLHGKVWFESSEEEGTTFFIAV